MRNDLDKFYTNDDNAVFCLNLVPDLKEYDVVIEPSAGSGAFSKKIPDCIALDIMPDDHSIQKMDWLTTSYDDFPRGRILVIGNPPFGKRSALAKKFIQQSINIGATTIAFILPDTFVKWTNQRMFNTDWRLISIDRLQNTNFILPHENKEIHIPCSFFVWTKDSSLNPNVNLRDSDVEDPTDFSFLKRGDQTADFSINGNNGKVKDLHEITNSKAEHYIKVKNGFTVEEMKKRFSSLNSDFYSSVNGGVAWIGQRDIIKRYNQIFHNESDK